MRWRSRIAAVLTSLAVSPLAQAALPWRGDFETGDLSQWSGTESAAPDRIQVVTSPVAQGRYAVRVTVRKGDEASKVGGTRAELVYNRDLPGEGDERYYHWQTYWPEEYPSADGWQIFTQWHQSESGGSPPLAFMVSGEEIRLGSGPKDLWTTPLKRGRWHDFLFHVKWSSDPAVGSVELWYDGKHVLKPRQGATLFPKELVYLKQGLYRKSSIDQPQTLFHDGMVVGTRLEDVVSAEKQRPQK